MKKLCIPLILIVLFACNQSPKTNDTKKDTLKVLEKVPDTNLTKPADTISNDPVVKIRRAVERINTSKTDKKHYELMCDEMMKIDYYTINDIIVKISVDFGTIGDVYAKEDYYYNEGELIFKYEFVEGGPACEGCIKTNEYRSYIKNNIVIKYLKDKDSTECRKCEFNENAKELRLINAKSTADIKEILCK